MELRLKKNLLIACINRKGKIIIPGGQDTIEMGDTVIVVTTNTGLSDLSDIIES
jgi:trk system potassium uptake protein TrkA